LSKIKLILFVLSFVFLSAVPSFAGTSFDAIPTDSADETLIGFFDLRDRETFIQITNVDSDPAGNNVHIQIFNVANNCNENDFFDFYTPADTHIYNLKDLQTNDGNASGVILPDGAYGVFIAFGEEDLIGNLRVLDNNGFEYRTNLQGADDVQEISGDDELFATFNFNTISGTTLSDVIAIPIDNNPVESPDGDLDPQEIGIANILDVWVNLDVNIFDINENVFSCRRVIYACINEDSPLQEALLEEVANFSSNSGANVANFEYGINNAIPHSKGGELLCPGNTISEGFVRFEHIRDGSETDEAVFVFVGLNNGNGRGSMDAFFTQNEVTSIFP